MKHWSKLLVTLAIATTVVGCAEMPGDKPAANAPRLVLDSDKVATWDHPGAFGPVPSGLQAGGDKICQSIGLKKAIGYHPKAEGVNGKPIAGGGYYCSN